MRGGQLESRTLVTNRAIVDTLIDRSPRTVLDVGCGEGWLARELALQGVDVTGVDAVPSLIEDAISAGGGDFHVASSENISETAISCPVDAIVCNFSLLGDKSVDDFMTRAPALLRPDGALVVQTLHPLANATHCPYADGWRQGSWCGLGPEFSEPAPWYYRTVSSWVALFRNNGFRLIAVQEPIHPKTRLPVSIIFTAEYDD